MSKIVRQRVSMHDESTSISLQSKNVNKKKSANRKRQPIKQLICIVSVPKSIGEYVYIKADVELTIVWEVQRRLLAPTTIESLVLINLELLDQENYSIEQIINLLTHKDDPCSQLAIQLVNQRFNILNEYTQHYYISNEELLEVEQIAKDYPYQCIIQKVNKDNSSLSQRIVNDQFYTIMGVTPDMMFNHLHETKTLPSIFDIGSSLKMWCDLTIGSISSVQYFDQYINTYEGAQFKCRIEQRQMFKRTQVNPNQIVFIEFWIYKLDEPLKSYLLNPQRLYINQIDYFNKKNTEEEYHLFQKSLKYKETPHYKNTQPCGYKLLPWI